MGIEIRIVEGSPNYYLGQKHYYLVDKRGYNVLSTMGEYLEILPTKIWILLKDKFKNKIDLNGCSHVCSEDYAILKEVREFLEALIICKKLR